MLCCAGLGPVEAIHRHRPTWRDSWRASLAFKCALRSVQMIAYLCYCVVTCGDWAWMLGLNDTEHFARLWSEAIHLDKWRGQGQ